MSTHPQVLLVGGTQMLRLELQVLAEHTGVTLLTAADAGEVRDAWQTARLVLVTVDAASGCMDLPARQDGHLMLIAGDDLQAAVNQGADLGCRYVIQWPIAVSWISAQMRTVHAAANLVDRITGRA